MGTFFIKESFDQTKSTAIHFSAGMKYKSRLIQLKHLKNYVQQLQLVHLNCFYITAA